MKCAIGIIAVVLLVAGVAPAHDVVLRLPQVITWRPVTAWGQPRLGIVVNPVMPELREYFGSSRDVGVLVGQVIAGSAADKAGLQTGDLIVAINGQDVSSVGDIAHALTGKHGMAIAVLVLRDKRQVTVSVQLAEKSAEVLGPYLDRRNDQMRRWLGLYERRDEMEQLEKRLQDLEDRMKQLEQR